MAALTVQHHWYNADPTKGSQVVEEEVEEITQKSGILSDTPQLTTVRIGTIVEKMKYDLSEFTVKAGKENSTKDVTVDSYITVEKLS